MRSILAWSIQLRVLVLSAAAVLMLFGANGLRTLPVDALPEFSRPYVEIQTEALGLSASEVEAMVTVPLEADMLNGAPWVSEIRSESLPGLSSIVLFFEPGADTLTARQVVKERLTEVHALPSVSKPPVMLQPVSSANRFLAIGLRSEEHSLIDLSVLSRWTLVPRLSGVPGVAQVSIWGQRKRQLQVQVDPERLRERNITLQQIINTTGNALWASPLTYLEASKPGTGGWIETPNQRLMVQHVFPISTPEDLAKVTVEGTRLSLGEVTEVVEDHQPLIGDAVIDESPSLMLVLEKFPWASTVEVTRSVEEAVAALELGLPGVEMTTTHFRPASYLELAKGNLAIALGLAAVLIVVGFLLTRGWRTALVAIAATFAAALASVSVLIVLGVGLDAMLIAGLAVALAVLVDDAMVDSAAVERRLCETSGGDETSRARLIFGALVDSRGPALYATAVLALCVLPVLFVEGIYGAFATPLVRAYGLAVLASLVAALTVTPALSVLLLGEVRETGAGLGITTRVEGGLARLAERVAALPRSAVAGSVAVLGAAVAVALFAATEGTPLPTLKERDVVISVDGPPGTSEHAMRRAVARISSDLRGISGVSKVSAHVGRAVQSDRTNDIHGGEVWASLERDADWDAALEAMREAVRGYPGFDIDVDTFLAERIGDEDGPENKLVVRVYGEDLSVLRAKAEEVETLLGGVDGLVSPEVQHPEEHANIEIEPNLEASKRHGLTPGEVRRAAATLLGGMEVGSLFEDQKVFDVVVWGTPELRHSKSSVENLLIDTPTGGHVRLREVADVRIAPHPPVIRRDAVARHVDVDAEIVGRSSAAVAADVRERLRGVEFPLEYRAELVMGGSSGRVRVVALAAALGALLVLQAAFGSWGLASAVLLALPLALVGGIASSALVGGLSFGALLGLLGVLGLALRNALALVASYRGRLAEGGVSASSVAEATRQQSAAILGSAVVTALAMLPILVFGPAAGLEILHPMAVAVLGGLVSSTAVVLLVVPALYAAFGAGAEPDIFVEEEAA